MVNPDVVRQKADRVAHHVQRLRNRAQLDARTLAADEDAWNALLIDLQQAIQACIDLAVHWCVDDALGLPTSAAQSFAVLERAGQIGHDLAVRLTSAAGMRNIIVHQYGELDAELVRAILVSGLDDLVAFVQRARDAVRAGQR